MIEISVNNEKKTVKQGQTVAALLENLGYQKVKVAVAINGDFVPRSGYDQAVINPDDRIDVLSAVQGG